MEIDDFVGKLFKTCKGVLEVKEIAYRKNYVKSYTLVCSECSKDTELWPYGSITSTKAGLLKGNRPCGCEGNTKWSKDQWKIRIKRVCDKRGYEFIGFAEDSWNGKDTKLVLKNKFSGHLWKSTSANNLVNRGRGDPLEAARLRSLDRIRDEEDLVSEFKSTGKFVEGCLFKRLSVGKGRGKWKFECPICKDDEYTKNCESSKSFITSGSSLLNGSLPCRCAKVYKWNKKEMLYRCKRLLKERGDTFLNVVGDYLGNKTLVKWESGKCGHENITPINKLLTGQRCNTCFKGGYKNSEKGILYVVLWEYKEASYIKYGITNKDVRSRCLKHKRYSEESPTFKILYEFYSVDGKEVENCEKFIKTYFSEYDKCPPYLLPEGFTETIPYSKDNLSQVLEIISTFNLQPSDT